LPDLVPPKRRNVDQDGIGLSRSQCGKCRGLSGTAGCEEHEARVSRNKIDDRARLFLALAHGPTQDGRPKKARIIELRSLTDRGHEPS
jgi:hypothetical protein